MAGGNLASATLKLFNKKSNLWKRRKYTKYLSIYIKANLAGWLAGRVCVRVARRRWAVAMQRGRFIFGPFWGQRHL
jgi:hypothetical protein